MIGLLDTRTRRALLATAFSVPVVHAAIALGLGNWNPGTWPADAWLLDILNTAGLAIFAWLIFEDYAA